MNWRNFWNIYHEGHSIAVNSNESNIHLQGQLLGRNKTSLCNELSFHFSNNLKVSIWIFEESGVRFRLGGHKICTEAGNA
jgi:hypothetical protein